MATNRQFVLGVFSIVALSILAFYTLFLTDFTLFSQPVQVEADFPGAHGLREGDPVKGYLPSGSVAGVIDDRPSCADLIASIVDEAEQTLKALAT